MVWIATFIDGPLAAQKHDRIFSAGDPWREMWLAPVGNVGIHGWTIVGGPGFEPDVEPWPEQVHYKLGELETAMTGHDGEPIARYQLCRDCHPLPDAE